MMLNQPRPPLHHCNPHLQHIGEVLEESQTTNQNVSIANMYHDWNSSLPTLLLEEPVVEQLGILFIHWYTQSNLCEMVCECVHGWANRRA